MSANTTAMGDKVGCADKKPILNLCFDSPHKVYMSGELVRGVINFITKGTEDIQILAVNLISEYYSYKNNEEVKEVIFTESCPLDYKGSGEGTDGLPFSIALRPDCPTSLATVFGGIRYSVIGTVMYKMDNKVISLDKQEYISVNSPTTVNEDLKEKKIVLREARMLACCFGSISATLEVKEASLLCGSQAEVNAVVLNETSRHVIMTRLTLLQILERFRDGRKLKRDVISKERGCILPGKRQVWLSEKICVPTLPPSTPIGFFKVSYRFQLEIQKSSNKILKLKLPAHVGNVPLETDSSFFSESSGRGPVEYRTSSTQEGDVPFKPLYISYIFP